ncbi:MAG: U-box domain-containing protein [Pseudomonadota bacterium]
MATKAAVGPAAKRRKTGKHKEQPVGVCKPEPGYAMDDFLCPITRALMVDPVTAPDGITYEREAITTWLRDNNTGPVDRMRMTARQLHPNVIVRTLICTMVSTGGWATDARALDEWRARRVVFLLEQGLYQEVLRLVPDHREARVRLVLQTADATARYQALRVAVAGLDQPLPWVMAACAALLDLWRDHDGSEAGLEGHLAMAERLLQEPRVRTLSAAEETLVVAVARRLLQHPRQRRRRGQLLALLQYCRDRLHQISGALVLLFGFAGKKAKNPQHAARLLKCHDDHPIALYWYGRILITPAEFGLTVVQPDTPDTTMARGLLTCAYAQERRSTQPACVVEALVRCMRRDVTEGYGWKPGVKDTLPWLLN